MILWRGSEMAWKRKSSEYHFLLILKSVLKSKINFEHFQFCLSTSIFVVIPSSFPLMKKSWSTKNNFLYSLARKSVEKYNSYSFSFSQLSLSHTHTLSLYLSLFLSHSFSLSFYFSLFLFLSLSISLSYSFTLSLVHSFEKCKLLPYKRWPVSQASKLF